MKLSSPTRVWLALVLLTLASFASVDPQSAGSAAVLILGLATAKAALVGWRFMEIHAAHRAWALAFAGMLTAQTLLLLWLSMRTA